MTTSDWLLYVPVVTAMAALALWGSVRLSRNRSQFEVGLFLN